MQATKMLVLMAMAVLLAGCVLSLEPLYTQKDEIFDPALLGVWVNEHEFGTWIFSRRPKKTG